MKTFTIEELNPRTMEWTLRAEIEVKDDEDQVDACAIFLNTHQPFHTLRVREKQS